jgi:hypothetical protein
MATGPFGSRRYPFSFRNSQITLAGDAWSYQHGEQKRTVAVLELPPVISPETAVKAAIAAKAREK